MANLPSGPGQTDSAHSVSVVMATDAGSTSSMGAVYNAAPATRTNGQTGPLEEDVKGNLRIAEQNPPAYENAADGIAGVHDKPAASAAYNAIAYDQFTKAQTGTIKASAGNLYRAYFSNTNAAAKVVALVNKASNPTTGDTPVAYFYIAANSTLVVEYRFGKRFSTGIAWIQAQTIGATTVTLDASSDILVSAEAS